MRGVVFSYHSQNCGGYDYSSNDHYAFPQDLCTVDAYGLPIVSLAEIAVNIASGKYSELPSRFVAFSCDDGSLLDWHDYNHPQFGMQRSFANILRDHLSTKGLIGKQLLTSFVIASPSARAAIDQGCYEGEPLSDDCWWTDAAREGLLAIENHSWDHVHTVLPPALLQHGSAGDFHTVDNYEKSDIQVRAASEFIDLRLAGTGHRTNLFAYPYGHESCFLSEHYLPQYQEEHGVMGAFTGEPKFIDATSRVYALPRLICGDAWRTQAQFESILQRLLEN